MPPKSSSSSDSQQLGAREQSVFKQLVRLYETKQYKKALKAADTILKRHATHGETLAMKGLVYNQLKRREDAHSLVKRGLEANFNSHVCWHVYGLIYRSENKYEQAIKCFDDRTQLLTFDGRQLTWRGVDDILAYCHSHSHHQLLVASYNPHTEQLDYQPLSHPPLVKYGQHSMVDLRHAAADQWSEVELSVTEDHTLFVSVAGGSGGTVIGCQYERQYTRVEAGQLLGLRGYQPVRLLAAARKGANTGNLQKRSVAAQIASKHLSRLTHSTNQPFTQRGGALCWSSRRRLLSGDRDRLAD